MFLSLKKNPLWGGFVVPVSAPYNSDLGSSIGETSVILRTAGSKLSSLTYHYPAESIIIATLGGSVPLLLLFLFIWRRKRKKEAANNIVRTNNVASSLNTFDEFNRRIG